MQGLKRRVEHTNARSQCRECTPHTFAWFLILRCYSVINEVFLVENRSAVCFCNLISRNCSDMLICANYSLLMETLVTFAHVHKSELCDGNTSMREGALALNRHLHRLPIKQQVPDSHESSAGI